MATDRRMTPDHSQAIVTCPRCKRELVATSFQKDAQRKSGLCIWCRECRSEIRKKSYYKDIEKTRAYHRQAQKKRRANGLANSRAYHLKVKYNLTLEEYAQIIETQQGKCAICGVLFTANPSGVRNTLKPTFPRIDHDHVTGRIRGVLCFHCNAALGHVRDNVDVIANMIRYLTR